MADSNTSGAGALADGRVNRTDAYITPELEQQIDTAMAELGCNKAQVAARLGLSLPQLKSRIALSALLSSKYFKRNVSLSKLKEKALAEAGVTDETGENGRMSAESVARQETIGVVQNARREMALLSESGQKQVEMSLLYMKRNRQRMWEIATGHTMRTLDDMMTLQNKLHDRASELLRREVKDELSVIEQKAVVSNIAELAAIQTRLFAQLEKNAILRSAIESKKAGGPKGKPGFQPITVVTNVNNGKPTTTVVEPASDGNDGGSNGESKPAGAGGAILDAEEVQPTGD